MNLNTFIDRLTNFKIKFSEKPSPIEISNKNLIFKTNTGTTYEFTNIQFDEANDQNIIWLDSGVCI